jgi:hypothetical protein
MRMFEMPNDPVNDGPNTFDAPHRRRQTAKGSNDRLIELRGRFRQADERSESEEDGRRLGFEQSR